jgi:hypothetical protein
MRKQVEEYDEDADDDGGGDGPRVGLTVSQLDLVAWESALANNQGALVQLLQQACRSLLFEKNLTLSPRMVLEAAVMQRLSVPTSDGGAGLMVPNSWQDQGATRQSQILDTLLDSEMVSRRLGSIISATYGLAIEAFKEVLYEQITGVTFEQLRRDLARKHYTALSTPVILNGAPQPAKCPAAPPPHRPLPSPVPSSPLLLFEAPLATLHLHCRCRR